MTPAAAASRPHSLIGGECGHEAALHGYEALAPGTRNSRTDRDPVRNIRFVIHLALTRLQQASLYVDQRGIWGCTALRARGRVRSLGGAT